LAGWPQIPESPEVLAVSLERAAQLANKKVWIETKGSSQLLFGP
jgi:hypothetical protein